MRSLPLIAWLLASIGILQGADDVPGWMRAASELPTPKYEKPVNAVVLHSESRVTMEANGRVTTNTLLAVRVLTRDGKDSAIGRVVYTPENTKIKEIRGWLIRPSGEVKKLGKESVVDAALVNNDVYNDVRMRFVSGGSNAEPGAVFGFEAVTEEQPVFNQFEWGFQERYPVLLSRYSMTLPDGAKSSAMVFNHEAIAPAVSGNTSTWELKDLPPIEREPISPSFSGLAARLAITVHPAAGGTGKSFENWGQVGQWLRDLSDPQMVTDNNLIEKAQSLTAKSKTDYERIEAIGRFVQTVQYVSIQTGVGRGGGYRPHAANQVLSKSYGDCKDKANLMRTMLKAVGVEAYQVSIYSGDPTHVREEWVSPQQFNHCILAARMKDSLDLPAMVNHPTLGKLLFFDPTDEFTPVGSLPDHEENSLALVGVPGPNALVRMPVSKAETNRLERTLHLTLDAEGNLAGTVQEVAFGHTAVDYRREHQRLSPADYQKYMERFVTMSGPSAVVKKVTVDEATAQVFKLNIDFATERYARSMKGRLLILTPAPFPGRGGAALRDSKRKYPAILEAETFTETADVQLPAGFDVDEIPWSGEKKSPFGVFQVSYEVKAGVLHFRRSLTVNAMVVPPEQYKDLREFFGYFYGSERAPVVLAKK